jgi:hypothetical protein
LNSANPYKQEVSFCVDGIPAREKIDQIRVLNMKTNKDVFFWLSVINSETGEHINNIETRANSPYEKIKKSFEEGIAIAYYHAAKRVLQEWRLSQEVLHCRVKFTF